MVVCSAEISLCLIIAEFQYFFCWKFQNCWNHNRPFVTGLVQDAGAGSGTCSKIRFLLKFWNWNRKLMIPCWMREEQKFFWLMQWVDSLDFAWETFCVIRGVQVRWHPCFFKQNFEKNFAENFSGFLDRNGHVALKTRVNRRFFYSRAQRGENFSVLNPFWSPAGRKMFGRKFL